MNWEHVEGNWKQLRGKLRSAFGKLTDDDMENAAGKKDSILGKLQERYGYAKDEAEKKLDEWIGALDSSPNKKTDHRS